MAAERLAGMARPEKCELPTFWARYVDFEEFPTSQLTKTGHFVQTADQAACSAKNLAQERIGFILSSRKPRSSSSRSRFSYKSLPNTSVSREPRKSYLRSIS